MTCCIAAKYDDGVLVVTDTALNFGENRFQMPNIKAQKWGPLYVAWAGDLWAVQRVFDGGFPAHAKDLLPAVEEFQTRLVTLSDKYHEDNKHPDYPAEFLVVDEEYDIHMFAGEGDKVSGFDYACIGHGSMPAWPLMDALYRGGSCYAVKRQLGKVMRLTDKYDRTVKAPFKYHEVV